MNLTSGNILTAGSEIAAIEDIKYTICFCVCGDLVLMLYRECPPNLHRWNGLGGKIEPGEDVFESVRREVFEESEVDLREAAEVSFTGLVTWKNTGANPFPSGGMYAFVARFPSEWPVWSVERRGPEGAIGWKPIGWVCDLGNDAITDNVPHFLPRMLGSKRPAEYRCRYMHGRLAEVTRYNTHSS